MNWFEIHFMGIYFSLLGLVIVLAFISESSMFWEMMGYKKRSKEHQRKYGVWEKSQNRISGRNGRRY